MLTEKEMSGMKSLASAILRSGLVDATRGFGADKLGEFAQSEWCEQLCGVVGISWNAYKRELARRVEAFIENSKPKRLRTYKLVEVLKNGKDTRTDKAKRLGEVRFPEHGDVDEVGEISRM